MSIKLNDDFLASDLNVIINESNNYFTNLCAYTDISDDEAKDFVNRNFSDL